MSGEFDGKSVIVTGAASGLGRATALAFAREGALLTLADVNADGLDATVAEAAKLGGQAIAVPTDLTDTAACASLVARAVAQFGGLDALCNVAGTIAFAHATEITPEVWDRIYAVNVRAPFFTIQAALPHLIEREGAVVTIASSSAFMGHAYLTPYTSSKAAVANLTKSLAMEFMHKPVRINAIAPGGIQTAMTTASGGGLPSDIDHSLMARFMPLRGISQPEDFTDAILMLAGPRGRSFHGATVQIDRGMTAG